MDPPRSRCWPSWCPRSACRRSIALSASVYQAAVIAGPALGGFIYALGPIPTYGSCLVAYCVAARGRRPPSGVAATNPGRAGWVRSRACAKAWPSCSRGRSCWARYRWTCSPSCSAGRSRCCRCLRGTSCMRGRMGLGALRSATAIGATCVALVLARMPHPAHTGHRMFAAVAAVRRGDHRLRPVAQHVPVDGGADRAGRGRPGQRLRALLADPAGDAGCDARPRQRREHAVHRGFQ